MTETPSLRRVLGPVDAIAVVIGAIVGVGIFFTPSRVAALVGSGSWVLATWAIGGLIAVLGALTYADLGRLYPRTGGQYELLRDAFGPALGFVYVTCNATAIQAGSVAIIALVCSHNLALAVTGAPAGTLAGGLIAGGLIVALMGINAVGGRQGAAVQNATVVAKLLTLLAVVGAASWFGGAPAPPDAPVVAAPAPASASAIATAVGAGLVPVLFSFGGWQQALWIGGEKRRPRRDVPLSILVGVGVVVAIYLATNWAYLQLLGHARVAASDTVAADAVAVVWGEGGRRALAGAVALSAFGVLNAQLLTGPRLVYAMALDGRFFRSFAQLHARTSTPVPAIAMLGGTALVLLALAGARGIDRLLTGVVLIDGLFFALTGAALLVLRRRAPSGPEGPARPYPGYPVTAALFVLAECGVVWGAFADPAVRAAAHVGLAWIAAALLAYLALFRRGRPGEDE
ncbi:MAG: amino acid permease [Myxococcales bacterium]|nr:amino acid permease [Myxococcales bacterium]